MARILLVFKGSLKAQGRRDLHWHNKLAGWSIINKKETHKSGGGSRKSSVLHVFVPKSVNLTVSAWLKNYFQLKTGNLTRMLSLLHHCRSFRPPVSPASMRCEHHGLDEAWEIQELPHCLPELEDTAFPGRTQFINEHGYLHIKITVPVTYDSRSTWLMVDLTVTWISLSISSRPLPPTGPSSFPIAWSYFWILWAYQQYVWLVFCPSQLSLKLV